MISPSYTLLIVATMFNAALAVFNGHVLAIGNGTVIATEAILYAFVIIWIMRNAYHYMWPWAVLVFFVVLLGLFLSAANGEMNAKYIRDALLIPLFILLGSIPQRDDIARALIIIQTIVLAGAVFEAIFPGAFTEMFRIQSYYINTRGFSAENFWNGDSTLFASATRPGDRFFNFVDIHRLSSIFLEPVSLGNYCIVIFIAMISLWGQLGLAARTYLLLSTVLLLIGCDGRLATTSIFIVVLVMPAIRLLSTRWAVLYLPAVLFLSLIMVWLFDPVAGADNFMGRLAGSWATISGISPLGLAGLDGTRAIQAIDSGIAYLLLTQSVLGALVIWLFISLTPRGSVAGSRVYFHGICLYFPLNLLVSYSFFSIKVAALIWFLYGYFYRLELESDFERSADGRNEFTSSDVVPKFYPVVSSLRRLVPLIKRMTGYAA